MVFNITIASNELRTYYYRDLILPTTNPPFIRVYDPGWIPQRIFLMSGVMFKSLGVKYPINLSDWTSVALMKQKLITFIRVISVKKESARAVSTVISKCLYSRGAYVGVLSAWSLAQCEELDKVFATEIRRRTKIMKSSQLENLF